jgi:branched-chain amino acid transport system ATP-binding protein
MLAIENLDVFHGDARALDGISLAVDEGSIVAIVGANGAGKTSLIRTIAGMYRPAAGRIVFRGTDISGWPSHRVCDRGIGQVAEGRQVFPTLTVAENLEMGAMVPRAQAPRLDNLARVFALFPILAERSDQAAGTLSGGEQQMLAIGRALMTNPHLLILDEATEGLAPLIREEIWQCLHQLARAGQSILVIDKYVERLVALAGRHTIVERGRVVWHGTSAALAQDRGLWHRYLGV